MKDTDILADTVRNHQPGGELCKAKPSPVFCFHENLNDCNIG